MDNLELDCHICLDMLVEPVSTHCGHTFCKLCLIRYLRDKYMCPMCRKPILQDPETLSKNILIENLVKSKYKDEYERKLDMNRMSYSNEYDSQDKLVKRNIPAIILKDAFLAPQTTRTCIIDNDILFETLKLSSINDRILIIIPDVEFNDKCSSLVEMMAFEIREGKALLKIKGLKRVKVDSFNEAVVDENNTNSLVFLANGHIIVDLPIDSEDLKQDLINKLAEINEINKNILNSTNHTVKRILERTYGKEPIFERERNLQEVLENISFYYLNITKIKNKKDLYLSKNIVERINL